MNNLYQIEENLYSNAHKYIACIDEVGRGCLYGEVIAAAIILPAFYSIEGCKDSKKLSSKKREFLYDYIINNSIGIGIGSVSSEIIDKINIKQATRLAMKRALKNLTNNLPNNIEPSIVLIDAETIETDLPQMNIIDGDNLIHGIAAASVVAKVYRDRLCIEWDKIHPGYDLHKNKGYGTKTHIKAIRELGPTINHRNTFIKKVLEGK